MLGVGNSMFQPLLGDNVLEVVKRGKAAIGIFGAQVLYGLVLGLIFPWVHELLKGNFADVRDEVKVEEKGAPKDE